MTAVTQTSGAGFQVQDNTRADHRVSWGALFAGLVLFFAVSWLLLLLGSALGVGIADATDLGAIGDGLGIGAIIWLLLTTLIATFTGALLAAKLAGSADDRVGALHGLTLWALSTIAVLLLGASGIGGAINAVSSAVTSGTKAGTAMIMNVEQSQSDSQSGLPDSVTTAVAATLKRQAARMVSTTATGSNGPKQADVRAAINALTPEDIGAISSALISGNPDEARQRLSDRTTLSDAEIDSVINGVQKQIDNVQQSEAVQQAEAWVEEQVNAAQHTASEAVSEMAGPEVSAAEVSQAVSELEADTLASAGKYLIQGKPERAKDVLVAQTTLSERDVDAIVDGAGQEIKQLVDEAKGELKQAAETVGAYTQAVLWTAFIAGALGLVAGLFGGYAGASTVRRIYSDRTLVR